MQHKYLWFGWLHHEGKKSETTYTLSLSHTHRIAISSKSLVNKTKSSYGMCVICINCMWEQTMPEVNTVGCRQYVDDHAHRKLFQTLFRFNNNIHIKRFNWNEFVCNTIFHLNACRRRRPMLTFTTNSKDI